MMYQKRYKKDCGAKWGCGDERYDEFRGGGWRMRRGHGKGHGRGRGPGRRGQGARRRALDHGDLRLLILKLVSDEARHGYDLIREIEARTGGAYVPSPGVIYPALEALLDQGLVEVQPDGQKRSFSLTDDGRNEMVAEAEALDRIEARLAELQDSERPEDPEDVREAMLRLRHSVIQSLRANHGDVDRRKAITDILSDAQDRISKLDDM